MKETVKDKLEKVILSCRSRGQFQVAANMLANAKNFDYISYQDYNETLDLLELCVGRGRSFKIRV